MQRQYLSPAEEREFIEGVINFIKKEKLIIKPDKKAVTDSDLCNNITGLSTNQLSRWRHRKGKFTVSMMKGIKNFLNRQEEIYKYRSETKDVAIRDQLRAFSLQLNKILVSETCMMEQGEDLIPFSVTQFVLENPSSALEADGAKLSASTETTDSDSSVQFSCIDHDDFHSSDVNKTVGTSTRQTNLSITEGSATPQSMAVTKTAYDSTTRTSNEQKQTLTTSDEDKIIQEVITFLKTKVMSGLKKVGDKEFCAASGLSPNEMKLWRKKKGHFKVKMKETLYQHLLKQNTQFVTDDVYKKLVKKLSQILDTTPWVTGGRSAKRKSQWQRLSKTAPTSKRTKFSDDYAGKHMSSTKWDDSLTPSSHSISTSSTPAPGIPDYESTNADLSSSADTLYEPVDDGTYSHFLKFILEEPHAFSPNVELVNPGDSAKVAPALLDGFDCDAATYAQPADALFNLEEDQPDAARANPERSNLRRFSTFTPTPVSSPERDENNEFDNLFII